MKKRIAKKWCEELRSRKYKQGKRRLRQGEKFCCLGVLCDLAVKAGLGEWKGGEYRHTAGEHDGVSCAVGLVAGVRHWSGVQTYDGAAGNGAAGYASLARMNDRGVGFPEIADFIEAHVKEL